MRAAAARATSSPYRSRRSARCFSTAAACASADLPSRTHKRPSGLTETDMTSSQRKIRWGIIGPGAIAKAFTAGVAGSRTGELAAIATRDRGEAGRGEAVPGARIVSGYEALLKDRDIEAVDIAPPHPSRAEWAIKAAEAGKHVLVEKPMGLTA